MSELTREWEREIRQGARSIWGRGYNETLTAIIAAARMNEKGDAVDIFIQREPWDDKACEDDHAMLASAFDNDILGLLDNALSYGVWIINNTTNWEYSAEASPAAVAERAAMLAEMFS